MQACYPSNFGCLPGPLSTTCITLQQHFLPSYQKWLYGRRQADQRRRWRTRSKVQTVVFSQERWISEHNHVKGHRTAYHLDDLPVPPLASGRRNSSPWRTFELPAGWGPTAAAPAYCPASPQTWAALVPRAAELLAPLDEQVELAGKTRASRSMDGFGIKRGGNAVLGKNGFKRFQWF